jgi:hypothetical protein
MDQPLGAVMEPRVTFMELARRVRARRDAPHAVARSAVAAGTEHPTGGPMIEPPTASWEWQRRARSASSTASGSARARALLGAEHPLLRVMDRMRTRSAQAGMVMVVIAASGAAALGGVLAARPVVVAAVVVEVAIACSLGMLGAERRDRVLDLIIDGRERLPLAIVARERQRLVDPRHRAQLSQSFEALGREAQHPRLRRPSDRPLFRRQVVAAVAQDLTETARGLRSNGAALSGVAMAERLLTRPDSPLYGDSAQLLRADLRRCRFLLTSGVDTSGVPDGPTTQRP